jgi:NADPH:quinone reductase-like Zn-dependent oxidoreductase
VLIDIHAASVNAADWQVRAWRYGKPARIPYVLGRDFSGVVSALGAGGVAGVAIQLARCIGARIITTASAANADYVRSLGADEVIDYRASDFTRVVRDCDAVFDTVGGDVAERSFSVRGPAAGWPSSPPA